MDGGYSLSAVFLLHCLFSYSSAGFIETPSMRNIGVDENVLLRCRHMRLDALIAWLINGTNSRLHSGVKDGSIYESDGTLLDTLTIPATSQYNGSEVVCLARFLDGSPDERSPPVTLIIITDGEGILIDISASTSPQAATDPTSPISTTSSTKLVYTTSVAAQTSTTKTTTPPSTTTDAVSAPTTTANFEITPDSLTVAVEQGTATFYCQHSSSDAVNWKVNRTSENKITSPSISFATSNSTGTVTFQTLLGFNQTTVECVAIFFDGSSPLLSTSPVTLLIQDTPGPVESASCKRNYSSNALITFWDSLPSLDINGTDPDIVYGVELYKITCGRDIFVNYEVATTNYTSNTIDPYQIYKTVISPRNNVEGARNGTSVIMEEKFMLIRNMLFQLTRSPRVIIEEETPVPSYYTVTLRSLDGSRKGLNTIIIDVTREGDHVTLSMDRTIPPQTLWNVSVHVYDCTTDRMEEDIELSTHDVQNVSVSSTHPGDIRVTGDITDGSTVTGVLVIVYSQSDVHYIASSPAEQGQNIDVTVTGLTDTNYGVSIFSMEKGIAFPRVVALPRTVDVDNTNKQTKQASLVEHTLQPNSHGVCINCTFLDSSATDCVIVVHQRISQLNSSGLMNIESSHKFTRSGNTASGCIEGVNLEDYEVGVVGVREPHPVMARTKEGTGVCSGCIAGAVLGVVFFVTSAVIVVVITLVIYKRRTKLAPQEHTEGGLLSPAGLTVNTPAICHQYEECQRKLTNQQREVTDVQGSSDSLDSSDLDNPPPIPPRLEEPSTPSPLEPNTASPSSPATTETDISSDSNSAGANDDDPGDPTYNQPVFTKTLGSSQTSIPPSLCADLNLTGGEGTHVQSADGPTYAQPQLTITSRVTCPPAADNVVYEEVKGFQGTHYAELSDMPASILTPDSHQKMEYAVVTQQPSKPTSDEGVGPDKEMDPNECSKNEISEEKITEDQAFHALLQYSSQWQSLGEALSLDEDCLDEIFTNNETDEACLQEMLQLYFKRSDLKHSWEEIHAARMKVEGKSLNMIIETTSNIWTQPDRMLVMKKVTLTSEESLVDDTHDSCQESGLDTPVEESMSDTNFKYQDAIKEQLKQFNEKTQGEPDVESYDNVGGDLTRSNGNAHDDLEPSCQESGFHSPVEESKSDANSNNEHMVEEQQIEEMLKFNMEEHVTQDETDIQSVTSDDTSSGSKGGQAMCITSDGTPPSRVAENDAGRIANDEIGDTQLCVMNFSPLVFSSPLSKDDTVITKTETATCQGSLGMSHAESNEDGETDYVTAMIKQLNLRCENKSRFIHLYRDCGRVISPYKLYQSSPRCKHESLLGTSCSGEQKSSENSNTHKQNNIMNFAPLVHGLQYQGDLDSAYQHLCELVLPCVKKVLLHQSHGQDVINKVSVNQMQENLEFPHATHGGNQILSGLCGMFVFTVHIMKYIMFMCSEKCLFLTCTSLPPPPPSPPSYSYPPACNFTNNAVVTPISLM